MTSHSPLATTLITCRDTNFTIWLIVPLDNSGVPDVRVMALGGSP